MQSTWGHQAVAATAADKLDIDEAEGGAPVLESRESIYEDTYLLKVGMGLSTKYATMYVSRREMVST